MITYSEFILSMNQAKFNRLNILKANMVSAEITNHVKDIYFLLYLLEV